MAKIQKAPQCVRDELVDAAAAYSQLLAKRAALTARRDELEAAVHAADAQQRQANLEEIAAVRATIEKEEIRFHDENLAREKWIHTIWEPANEKWRSYQYHLQLNEKRKTRGAKTDAWFGEIPPNPETLKGPQVPQPIPQALLERRAALVKAAQETVEKTAGAVRALMECRANAARLDDQILDAEKRLVTAQDKLREAEQREEDSYVAVERERQQQSMAAEAELAKAREAFEAAERRAVALRENAGK
jgi:hypothetical protein